jgi:putative tricarboxylic transport membrane protein
MMDKSYRQAMISAEGNIGQFAGEFFTAPLSFIILTALTLTIVSQTQWWKRLRGRA